jgi:hypothetical protein
LYHFEKFLLCLFCFLDFIKLTFLQCIQQIYSSVNIYKKWVKKKWYKRISIYHDFIQPIIFYSSINIRSERLLTISRDVWFKISRYLTVLTLFQHIFDKWAACHIHLKFRSLNIRSFVLYSHIIFLSILFIKTGKKVG